MDPQQLLLGKLRSLAIEHLAIQQGCLWQVRNNKILQKLNQFDELQKKFLSNKVHIFVRSTLLNQRLANNTSGYEIKNSTVRYYDNEHLTMSQTFSNSILTEKDDDKALGFLYQMVEKLKHAIIVLMGVSGSGKSHTMMALIDHICQNMSVCSITALEYSLAEEDINKSPAQIASQQRNFVFYTAKNGQSQDILKFMRKIEKMRIKKSTSLNANGSRSVLCVKIAIKPQKTPIIIYDFPGNQKLQGNESKMINTLNCQLFNLLKQFSGVETKKNLLEKTSNYSCISKLRQEIFQEKPLISMLLHIRSLKQPKLQAVQKKLIQDTAGIMKNTLNKK